jgi:hypothetical protein
VRAHHYRITVDRLDPLKPGEGGLESVSFFATTSSDMLAAAKILRERLGCSACVATRLAIAQGLLAEESAVRDPFSSLVIPTEA